MPLVYEDSPEAVEVLLNDEMEGLGFHANIQKIMRQIAQRKRNLRVARPVNWRDRRRYYPVKHGRHHLRRRPPGWFRGRRHPRTVVTRPQRPPAWGRIIARPQPVSHIKPWVPWGRRGRRIHPRLLQRMRAVQTAKCKRLLARQGMLSDYLQVEGIDMEPDLGQIDIFKRVMTSLGLRNPLSHYEPEMYAAKDWAGIFAKYDADLKQWTARIGKLGVSGRVKGPLSKKAKDAREMLNRVRAAVAPGAKPGTRDLDRLGVAIQEIRFLAREIRAAEKKYGARVPAPPPILTLPPRPLPPRPVAVPVGPAVPAPTEEPGIPAWAIPAGIVGLLLLA